MALCVFGLIYSYFTFLGIMAAKDALAVGAGNLKALHALERDVGRYKNAKQQFETLPGGARIVPISEIIATSAISNRVSDARDIRVKVGDGWSMLQKEIVLNEVNIRDAVEFVRKAETVRPPWWLKKIVIRSSARDAGFGQVILTVETLEKSGS